MQRILGEGAFGVVVLAEKSLETADGEIGWSENCELDQKLRCQTGLTQVAIKMVCARKGEEPIAMREGLVLSLIDSELVPRVRREEKRDERQ